MLRSPVAFPPDHIAAAPRPGAAQDARVVSPWTPSFFGLASACFDRRRGDRAERPLARTHQGLRFEPMPKLSANRRGVVLGLVAAVSFGISAPLAKRLLTEVSPQMLAGLLYVGAFLALSAVRPTTQSEAHLRRADAPRLTAMIVAGGVLAPVLLLLGLERVSGVAGSLLLNLEGPFTILLGVLIFREHLPRRAALGAVVIFTGAIALGLGPGDTRADWVGILLIVAACAAWSLDNNLTQALTVRDPRAIVRVKTGVAGTVNVALAFVIGEQLPGASILAAALVLGAVSYGLSVYFDALALRQLGAAREAAVFAVAPFAGALLAPFVLPETLRPLDLLAGALMAVGVILLLREQHEHVHVHEPLDHDHLHVHDEHHHHSHPPGVDPREPHAHEHHHQALTHSHPHVSDVHHRHSHRPAT
jgi:drug/metabolite transporter (DMT)-like permease